MFDIESILRTVRSASFNEDVAQELLLELVRKAETSKEAFRVLDVVAHMVSDSAALEELYQAINSGELQITPRRKGS